MVSGAVATEGSGSIPLMMNGPLQGAGDQPRVAYDTSVKRR
jgi:hypothetical protein